MKKILLAGLVAATGTLNAVNDTQKTELILRDHRHRAAMFTTFHALQSKDKQNFGTKVQIMGFYNETCDSSELGEVFGANGKNYIKVGTAAEVTAGTADVENNFLLHYWINPSLNTLKGTIKFNPEHSAYGTNIELVTHLDKILKGLYLKKSCILMTVKNDLNMTVCDGATGAVSTEAHSINDLLSGKRILRALGSDANNYRNEQQPLRYAKIRGSESRTGLANLETILGWNFLDKKNYHFGINIALNSPSGDRPTGEYLWEPRLGSQHWALGFGFDGSFTLFDWDNSSLKIFGEFHYRYEFEETEKRTLGIKNVLTASKYNKHILSHYYLLVEDKQYTLIPAANVLTKDVDVTPGSQIDTFITLNYNLNGFVFDVGYNLFWREREDVDLSACHWDNNKYGIAKFNTITASSAFSIINAVPANSHTQPDNTPINYENVDVSVAETDSILSHQIYGAIGYVFKKWKNPLMLGLGGAYEFGEDRSAADSWTIWLKGGLAF